MLIEKSELRYTLGGVAVFEGVFHHTSEVFQAGAMRRLEFDIQVLSFADPAVGLSRLEVGSDLLMSGFIAPRSLRSQRLTVHVTEFTIRS